jgi:glycosyltransferase involved in cell wall biosynthesis
MNPVFPIAPPTPGRIRVLEVVGNAIVGGMETCVTRLIERLPRDRFTVTVVCPFESRVTDQMRSLDVEVLITPMPEDPPWASILMTCSLVKAGAIDVLHAHMPNAHLLAGLAGRLCGKPVVTTIHGRTVSPMDIEVHRAAGTHVSVVCKHSYFHALSMGVNAAQLSCIPNGVDTEIFKPGRAGECDLRRHFGMDDDAPLIGYVGRLSVEKGPEVFLHSALLMRNTLPSARFVMVGEGPMREQLARFIENFQLADFVHLAGLRDDMPAIYRQLDAVVSTSHTESMPLALMEAMASGLPIVATRVGGVPDLVEQGSTGWLAAPRDMEAIASQVTRLFQAPGVAARMGQNARKRALDRFSISDHIERTAGLLSQLAASTTATRQAPRSGIGAVVSGTSRKPPNGVERAQSTQGDA